MEFLYIHIYLFHHPFCCAVWPLGSSTWLCAINFINQSKIHGFHFWNYSDSLKHIWGKRPGRVISSTLNSEDLKRKVNIQLQMKHWQEKFTYIFVFMARCIYEFNL